MCFPSVWLLCSSNQVFFFSPPRFNIRLFLYFADSDPGFTRRAKEKDKCWVKIPCWLSGIAEILTSGFRQCVLHGGAQTYSRASKNVGISRGFLLYFFHTSWSINLRVSRWKTKSRWLSCNNRLSLLLQTILFNERRASQLDGSCWQEMEGSLIWGFKLNLEMNKRTVEMFSFHEWL